MIGAALCFLLRGHVAAANRLDCPHKKVSPANSLTSGWEFGKSVAAVTEKPLGEDFSTISPDDQHSRFEFKQLAKALWWSNRLFCPPHSALNSLMLDKRSELNLKLTECQPAFCFLAGCASIVRTPRTLTRWIFR